MISWRSIKNDDIPEIMSMNSELYRFNELPSLDDLMNIIDNFDATAMLYNNRIIGNYQIIQNNGLWEIDGAAIIREFQNKKFSNIMLEHILKKYPVNIHALTRYRKIGKLLQEYGFEKNGQSIINGFIYYDWIIK